MNKIIFCCNCGVEFGIPGELDRNLRNTHKTFYCPNGHGQCYSQDFPFALELTDAERWKKRFEEESMKNRSVAENSKEAKP